MTGPAADACRGKNWRIGSPSNLLANRIFYRYFIPGPLIFPPKLPPLDRCAALQPASELANEPHRCARVEASRNSGPPRDRDKITALSKATEETAGGPGSKPRRRLTATVHEVAGTTVPQVVHAHIGQAGRLPSLVPAMEHRPERLQRGRVGHHKGAPLPPGQLGQNVHRRLRQRHMTGLRCFGPMHRNAPHLLIELELIPSGIEQLALPTPAEQQQSYDVFQLCVGAGLDSLARRPAQKGQGAALSTPHRVKRKTGLETYNNLQLL